ncbi:MAG: DUF262 domain-containing protein [Opitutales bacterium]|nr:DUF262 domain-containing protein [Opitutales bacterium]
MISEVTKPTVSDIFSAKKEIFYKIPKYQREYTWSTNEWNALFKDICENEKGYFLGSYICVVRNDESKLTQGKISFELIDGQQRFATLTILLATLYAKLAEQKNAMSDEDRLSFVELKKMLAVNTGRDRYEQRLVLQEQNSNNQDYSYILSDVGIILPKREKPANLGNRRIGKAYRYFGKLIDDEVVDLKSKDSELSTIEALLQIVGKVESAALVGIAVKTNKDAYMLFESLNHRGIPLSAIDLIKNSLIAMAENVGNAENAYEQWKQILFAVGADDYSTQERFFRQYYNAFREELNRPFAEQCEKSSYYFGYLATRTTLLDIYEKMIKNDYQKLLNDLWEKSKKYSIIVGNSEEEFEFGDALLDLSRISGAPSYILLLYLLSEQIRLELSNADITQIISLLITFFVRRNLTDIPNTRKLTQLFIDLVSGIQELRGSSIVSFVEDKLKSISAADSIFEEKLRGPVYDENPEATRFILCKFEEEHQTKETYSNLWRKENKKYVWTIEHIFPKGDKIPKCWVDMIAAGDEKLAEAHKEKYAHTIGNLTLTGYNQNLSNLSFDSKKNRKSKDGKEVGYRNGLHLNRDVVDKDQWTIEHISERTDSLVKIFLEMYSW